MVNKMSAVDTIDTFLKELRAHPKFVAATQAGHVAVAQFDGVEIVLRHLCISDHPSTIELCDAVCDVIERHDLTPKERLDALIPVLMKARDELGGPEH